MVYKRAANRLRKIASAPSPDSYSHSFLPSLVLSLMILDRSSPLPLKRRRFTNVDPMEAEQAEAKLSAVKEKLGREIRVFETSPPSSSSPKQESRAEEPDDFYDFTPEDYYRIMASSKKEDKFLKTRKLREAEEASRKSKITKAVIRVRFPDNHTLEATFHPSETFQSLVDLLSKVIAKPQLPFYLYTTPPKRQIKDLSQDFYSAGFIPGAIVYFAYDIPKGEDAAAANSDPFLHEEFMSLKGLELITEQAEPEEPVQSASEPVIPIPAPVVQESRPAERQSGKPKWLRL